jgi:hypothetical protein
MNTMIPLMIRERPPVDFAESFRRAAIARMTMEQLREYFAEKRRKKQREAAVWDYIRHQPMPPQLQQRIDPVPMPQFNPDPPGYRSRWDV